MVAVVFAGYICRHPGNDDPRASRANHLVQRLAMPESLQRVQHVLGWGSDPGKNQIFVMPLAASDRRASISRSSAIALPCSIPTAFPQNFPRVVKITATHIPASGIHCHGAERPHASWRAYGGAEDGAQYSSLKQVNRGNVTQLKPVWIASTGDEALYAFNPLVIGDTLYALAEKGKHPRARCSDRQAEVVAQHPCKDAARARRHRNNLE